MNITEAKKNLAKEKIEELKALNGRPIDTSDIPELTKADFLEMWLKSYGKGYQSRINTILRQAMDTDKKANVF